MVPSFSAVFRRIGPGYVLLVTIGLDTLFGVMFAVAQHASIGEGLYFATTTATTVGYGDIAPRGWAPHLIAVAIMLTVIPLFSAVFSLLTTNLTAKHVDSRHDELSNRLDLHHDKLKHIERAVNGGPGSNPGIDS